MSTHTKSRAQPPASSTVRQQRARKTFRHSSALLYDQVLNGALARRIEAIRRRCLTLEERYAPSVQRVARGLRPNARNLLHYVALRQDD